MVRFFYDCSISKIEMNHAANTLAFVHQVEGLIDLFQPHGVRDEGVQGNLPFLCFLYITWQLGAPLHATESRTSPDAAGDQLERTRAELCPCRGNPDDGRFPPAFVAALQGSPHQLNVADALEGVINAAVGHLHDHVLNGLLMFLRVEEVSSAQFPCDVELGRVEINGDDARGLCHPCTNDRRQTDATQTENGHARAFLHLGGIQHGANSGSDAAAQQADLVQRRILGNPGQGNFWQHGVLGEGRAAHVVVDRLALIGKAAGAVRHQAFALGGAHGLAEVGLAGCAEFALAAFGGVQRDDVVTDLQRFDAFAYRLDDAPPSCPRM